MIRLPRDMMWSSGHSRNFHRCNKLNSAWKHINNSKSYLREYNNTLPRALPTARYLLSLLKVVQNTKLTGVLDVDHREQIVHEGCLTILKESLHTHLMKVLVSYHHNYSSHRLLQTSSSLFSHLQPTPFEMNH